MSQKTTKTQAPTPKVARIRINLTLDEKRTMSLRKLCQRYGITPSAMLSIALTEKAEREGVTDAIQS